MGESREKVGDNNNSSSLLSVSIILPVVQHLSATTPTLKDETRLGCIIPCYWDVGSEYWDTIINTKQVYSSVPIAVVLNVTGGEKGKLTDQEVSLWKYQIERLRSVNIIVLGRVDTEVAQVSTEFIKWKIDLWRHYFGDRIDGIFFDRMGIQASQHGFYGIIANYAKNDKGFAVTVGNVRTPAAVIDEMWTSPDTGINIDTFVVWDGAGVLDPVDSSYQKYQFKVYRNRLAAIACGIPSLDPAWVCQIGQYVGWIYTTTADNYEGSVSPYYTNLVSLLDQVSSGFQTTAGGARLVGNQPGQSRAPNDSSTDQWGIRKIYWTTSGGAEYYVNNNNLPGDPRVDNVDGEGVSRQSDGSWQSRGGSNGQLRVEMWSASGNPWTTPECTIYARHISGSSSYTFQLYTQGGHHSSRRPCDGTTYKFRWASNSTVAFAKEVCHSAYSSNQARRSSPSWDNGRWHGLKAVRWSSGGSAKLELYADPDCSDGNGNLSIRNNWRLYTSITDSGGWCAGSSSYNSDCDGCGVSRCEVLTGTYTVNNRNLCAYRTDGRTTRFKFFSARNIDPGRPTSGSPPSGSPAPSEPDPGAPPSPPPNPPPSQPPPTAPPPAPPPPGAPPPPPPSTAPPPALEPPPPPPRPPGAPPPAPPPLVAPPPPGVAPPPGPPVPGAPPPVPSPPGAAPPPTGGAGPGTGGAGTTTQDGWSVKKVYPTVLGGNEWYMDMSAPQTPMTAAHRNRLAISGARISKNSDGSYKARITSNRAPCFIAVAQRNGYNAKICATTSKNHASLYTRGFMQDRTDWKNIEMTAYIRVNRLASGGEGSIQLFCRGGRHVDPGPDCEGCALRGFLYTNGDMSCQKEQWHSSFAPARRRGGGIGSIVGKWIGIKFVAITKQVSGTIITKQEIWLDRANKNIWERWDERTDNGRWGRTGDRCRGAKDQMIVWGGPLAFFAWVNCADVDFKHFSVREIAPYAVPVFVMPPSSGDPSDLPPPIDPGSGGGTGTGTWQNPSGGGTGGGTNSNLCGS